VSGPGPGRAADPSSAADSGVHVEVVTSLARFEAMGDEWDRVASRFGRALLRHSWFLSAAEALHQERDLRVVAIRRAGRLVAAAPLVAVHDGWLPRLQLLGMPALYEPSGPIYEDAPALQALARALVRLAQPIVLQRLDAGGPVPAALREAVGGWGLVIARPTGPTVAVPIRGSWTAYESTLSSHIRGNLRRQRARAARLGTLSTEVAVPSEADVDAWLETVIAVEGSGWKGESGSALRCRPDLQSFFTRYARREARAGRLRVACLRIGDRVAAVELAVEDFQRWWQLKIGYAHDLRPFYPGLQLTGEMVRQAHDRGLDAYEFLGSAAEWEARWRPETRDLEVCLVYPATLRGGAALADDAARVAIRRVRDRRKRDAPPAAEAAGPDA
jgi:CelD/BcsL family acetyltransferase involved in cellulose biosynthesis